VLVADDDPFVDSGAPAKLEVLLGLENGDGLSPTLGKPEALTEEEAVINDPGAPVKLPGPLGLGKGEPGLLPNVGEPLVLVAYDDPFVDPGAPAKLEVLLDLENGDGLSPPLGKPEALTEEETVVNDPGAPVKLLGPLSLEKGETELLPNVGEPVVVVVAEGDDLVVVLNDPGAPATLGVLRGLEGRFGLLVVLSLVDASLFTIEAAGSPSPNLGEPMERFVADGSMIGLLAF